ncbi:PREDICTED: msx2-interacting protein-like isoform X2 [Amphimedon queenslandica]|uniref:Uncharacterized protein n=1 Tax=Amphimedon queenslandica TaxID=400682 RepID=A0AAN0JE81_AMPQE|nr:PREDICTED: msx2-interacting protein-like isoform X2 [Amphimedon queenslandica]|eukprot:XP_019855294.1 PREDICTED: msx2-interacting protein-like isoform X2 [Amphimedon queenslandica]
MSTNSLSAKESRHLCISGLPKVDEGELLRLFSEFGEVESIKLLSQNDPNGGLSACIDFYKDDDAVAAFKADIKIKGSEVKKSFCDQSSKCKEHPHFTTASGDEEHRSTTSSTSSSSSTSSDARSSSVSSTTDSEGETEVVKQKQSPENESLILKFMNLSHHRSESSVHEALYQKCCSYSSKPKVKLYGEDEQRYALVKFQSLRERDNALNSLHGISIFGVKLKVTIFYNADFPSGGRELNLHVSAPSHEDQYSSSLTPLGFSHGNPFISPGNEFDPSATRSLFVGNIHKNVSIYDLRDVFQRYGHILDVEIKKMSGNATYGFVLFFNLLSAINAKKAMDGAQLGRNRIRVGFGKGTPSKVLWIDGIDASLNETQVKSHFSKYGTVVRIGIDRSTYTAMVQFDKVDEAKDALSSVKGSFICNTHSKIMADFANRDAKAAFFTHLESMDGQSQSFYSRPPPTTAKSLMRHRPFAVLPGLPRPPLDYYSYQYVEPDYYGYRSYDVRAAEVAPRHYSQYGVGSGDYEDDLREFSKKRERERERRIDKEERKRSQFSSREYSSSDTENPRHKKQPEEKQKRKTKKIRKCSTSSKSDDDCSTCVRTKSDSNTLKDKSCGGAPLSEDNEPEALLHSTDGRPKISIAWKGKPLKLDRLSFLQPPVSSVSTDVSMKEEKLESDVSSNEDCDYVKPNSHTCKYSDLSNRMQDENAPEYKLFLNDKSTNVTHSRSLIKDSMRSTQHSKSTRHDLASKIKKKERTSTSINKEHKDVSSASSRASDSHDHRMSHFSQCISKNGSSHSSGSPALYRQKSPLPRQPHSPMSRPHSPNHQRSRSPVFRRQRSPTMHSSHSSPRHPHSPTSRSSRSPTTHHSPSSYRSRSPLSHRPRSPVSHRFRSPISGRSQRSPVSSRSRRSPVLGRSHRSPVSGRSQRSPVSARSQRSPVSARSQRSPVSGRSQRSPFSGRSQRSPVSVRSHRSPVSVRSQKSLTSGRSQKSPVSGRSQRSPVSGRSQRSPVSGRSQRNLVSGRSRRSPVSGRSQSSGRSRRSPVSDQSQRSPFSGRPHSPRSWHLQSHASQDPVSRYSRSPSPCLHKRRSQTPILKTENLISHETRKSRHIRSGQNNKQNTSSELPNTSMCKYSPPHHARHSRSPHRVEQLHDYSPRRSSRFRASPPVSSSSRSPTSYHRKVSNDQTKSKGHYSKSASPVNQHTPPSSPIPSSKTSEVNSSLCPPDLPCPSASQNTTFYPDDDVSEVNIITDDVHIEVDEDLSQSVFLEQLLNKYPVVWQGSLSLKNDAALLQFHFLSGNDNLPSMGLLHDMDCKIIGTIPTLHISQRMKLEPLHLKGIEKCMEKQTDYCLLLGLPCGLDSYDIAKQTSSLQKSIISYLWLKQAAGIINLSTEEDSKIALHIFPPCQFSRSHLSKVAPDMLAVALDDAHLFIVLAVAVNDNS